MTSGLSRTISYSYFDKALKIQKTSSENTEFSYGSSCARYLRKDLKDGVTTRTVYIGNLEIIRKAISQSCKQDVPYQEVLLTNTPMVIVACTLCTKTI